MEGHFGVERDFGEEGTSTHHAPRAGEQVGGGQAAERLPQRISFGGVRSASTFSVRTSSPQTT